MNLHFISFLLDIAIFVALGVYAGRQVFFHHFKRQEDKLQIQISYAALSVITGLFAILVLGLPEVGLAIEALTTVSLTLFMYTLIRYPKFRNSIFRYSRSANRKYPHQPVYHRI